MKQQNKRTVVSVFDVSIVGVEQVVTHSDSVKLVVVLEVRPECPLHCRLASTYGETKSSRHVVDKLLQVIAGLGGSVEGRSIADHGLGDGLTEGNVDVGDAELFEEDTDFLVELVGERAGQSVGQDADPDGGIGVVPLSVLDGLDGWDGGIGSLDISITEFALLVFLVGHSVLVLVRLDLVVVELVKPSKADEVDGRDADVSFDKELGDLGTNVNPEIRTL